MAHFPPGCDDGDGVGDDGDDVRDDAPKGLFINDVITQLEVSEGTISIQGNNC